MIETFNLSETQNLALNSSEFPVSPGKKYLANTNVTGIKGGKCSAYFSIIFLDAKGKEILRRIRWLNDFSGTPIKYFIIAKAPENAKSAVLAYRINTEIAIESEWIGSITDIEKLNLDEVSDSIAEDYDDIMEAHRVRASLNFRILSDEEELQIENNIIWVFGSPRSGSSWLVTQLLNHKEIIQWNEPLIGAHLSVLETDVWHMLNPPDKRNIINIKRTIDVHADEPDYFFSRSYQSVWAYYLRKMILHRIYSQVQASLNKKIVIKEPNGSLAADVISRAMPNSKILFLLRDGRDIVDSKLDLYRKDSWVKKWIDPPPLTEQRRRWVIISESNIWRKLTEVVYDAFKRHSPDKRFFIKYEDLRINTSLELRRIYEFLGIQVSHEYIEDLAIRYSFENIPEDEKGQGKIVRKAKPGGWRETFSDEEREIMHSIMGNLLKEFGYDF